MAGEPLPGNATQTELQTSLAEHAGPGNAAQVELNVAAGEMPPTSLSVEQATTQAELNVAAEHGQNPAMPPFCRTGHRAERSLRRAHPGRGLQEPLQQPMALVHAGLATRGWPSPLQPLDRNPIVNPGADDLTAMTTTTQAELNTAHGGIPTMDLTAEQATELNVIAGAWCPMHQGADA